MHNIISKPLLLFKALLHCPFFSRPSPKAGRELQTELDRITNGGRTLSEKSAGAGHRAVSLHSVLVPICAIWWHQQFVFSGGTHDPDPVYEMDFEKVHSSTVHYSTEVSNL